MTTHSDINYPLCEEQMAEAYADQIKGAHDNDHSAGIMVRVTDVDHQNLDYQRIAQLIQDNINTEGVEISWREVPDTELILYTTDRLDGDHLIVFKREGDDNG